jgi:hypothetical protein
MTEISIPTPSGRHKESIDFMEEEDLAEKYEAVQVTKLDTTDWVKGGEGRDLRILAITFPKGRNGYTVLTLMDMFTRNHGTQVYRNREKLLRRKK